MTESFISGTFFSRALPETKSAPETEFTLHDLINDEAQPIGIKMPDDDEADPLEAFYTEPWHPIAQPPYSYPTQYIP